MPRERRGEAGKGRGAPLLGNNGGVRMKRYWVSWHQLSDDYRPLQDPPQPENVKAWWCSGSGSGYSILCSIVDAESEWEVRQAIEQAWGSGDVGDFRFIEECANDWLPGNRFPIEKDWERERLGQVEAA
jgi:hypothetical protein